MLLCQFVLCKIFHLIINGEDHRITVLIIFFVQFRLHGFDGILLSEYR